ncbi:hypothetical protein TIFTF001_030637 [Ficus carica]|uniref:Uncharacterized protein n=1 Tax=Ficus carica TaxID=3494 RepID=A0AA88J010_FICCA|nr:hypothetical protein TIFTF001_030637 [Ficus carica]
MHGTLVGLQHEDGAGYTQRDPKESDSLGPPHMCGPPSRLFEPQFSKEEECYCLGVEMRSSSGMSKVALAAYYSWPLATSSIATGGDVAVLQPCSWGLVLWLLEERPVLESLWMSLSFGSRAPQSREVNSGVTRGQLRSNKKSASEQQEVSSRVIGCQLQSHTKSLPKVMRVNVLMSPKMLTLVIIPLELKWIEDNSINSERVGSLSQGGPPLFIEEGPITDVERFFLVVHWGHLS